MQNVIVAYQTFYQVHLRLNYLIQVLEQYRFIQFDSFNIVLADNLFEESVVSGFNISNSLRSIKQVRQEGLKDNLVDVFKLQEQIAIV